MKLKVTDNAAIQKRAQAKHCGMNLFVNATFKVSFFIFVVFLSPANARISG